MNKSPPSMTESCAGPAAAGRTAPASIAAAASGPKADRMTDHAAAGAARIAAVLGEGRFLLDNGRCAEQALCCLLTPQQEDLVCVVEAGTAVFVSAVLRRPGGEAPLAVELHVPGAASVHLRQSRVEVEAFDGIALRAAREIELTAAVGAVRISARDLLATAIESAVTSAGCHLVRAGEYLLDASRLLRLRGGHTQITADGDMRVDGERITMG